MSVATLSEHTPKTKVKSQARVARKFLNQRLPSLHFRLKNFKFSLSNLVVFLAADARTSSFVRQSDPHFASHLSCLPFVTDSYHEPIFVYLSIYAIMNTTTISSRPSKGARTQEKIKDVVTTALVNLDKENNKSLLLQAQKEKKNNTSITITKTRKVLGELSASQVQARNAAYPVHLSSSPLPVGAGLRNSGQTTTRSSDDERKNESLSDTTRIASTRRPRQSVKKKSSEILDIITPTSTNRPSILLRQQPPRRASEAARLASSTIFSTTKSRIKSAANSAHGLDKSSAPLFVSPPRHECA